MGIPDSRPTPPPRQFLHVYDTEIAQRHGYVEPIGGLSFQCAPEAIRRTLMHEGTCTRKRDFPVKSRCNSPSDVLAGYRFIGVP